MKTGDGKQARNEKNYKLNKYLKNNKCLLQRLLDFTCPTQNKDTEVEEYIKLSHAVLCNRQGKIEHFGTVCL